MCPLIIAENEFGVVEIDFKTKPFLLIENISYPVVILGDTYGRIEKFSAIPSFVVMAIDVFKCKIIAQSRLVDLNIAMRIPFGIIPPGKIDFPFSFFFCFLGKAKNRR
jgi:hypothetical protein